MMEAAIIDIVIIFVIVVAVDVSHFSQLASEYEQQQDLRCSLAAVTFFLMKKKKYIC